MRDWSVLRSVCVALLLVGCGDPPSKEMDQAQGAIDAARAAGADRYAAAEYAAATGALTRAEQAVRDRDYRLALNDALESLEHARNAASEAADTRERLRGEVERLTAEVDALLTQSEQALTAAVSARVPRTALGPHQEVVAAVTASLQEASAAVGTGDFSAATTALTGAKERLRDVIVAADALTAAQTSRRRR